MKHRLVTALAITILAGAIVIAADATGTWTGTLTPADGNGGPAHLVLKQEGEKLTGTAGPDPGEQHPIEKGKADNGVLTFELSTGGGVMKFALKQEGDEITGDITRERDGRTQMAKLAVKRAKPGGQ